jgi:hypothetical protein
MCDPKEPGFFSFRHKWERGFDWYESLFEHAGTAVAGDASTTYSLAGIYPEVPVRIAAYAPRARIVYLTRNPITRLESSWIERRSARHSVPRDFSKAIRTVPVFLDGSRYWRQLSAYRDVFPDAQVLVLFFEELIQNPQSVADEVFAHLGIAGCAIEPGTGSINPSKGKRQDSRLLELARRSGLLRAARWLAPDSWRSATRETLSQEISARPAWTPETLDWAVDQLRLDSQRLLEYCGKPPDYWELPPPVLMKQGPAMSFRSRTRTR